MLNQRLYSALNVLYGCKQCPCPDTPEKHLPGQTPENAHSVRRRILRMLGFEPEQIICPGSFRSQQYLDEILFPLYISA